MIAGLAKRMVLEGSAKVARSRKLALSSTTMSAHCPTLR